MEGCSAAAKRERARKRARTKTPTFSAAHARSRFRGGRCPCVWCVWVRRRFDTGRLTYTIRPAMPKARAGARLSTWPRWYLVVEPCLGATSTSIPYT